MHCVLCVIHMYIYSICFSSICQVRIVRLVCVVTFSFNDENVDDKSKGGIQKESNGDYRTLTD